MKYNEQLMNPKWQKKRLRVFERDHWTCQVCGDTTSTLIVHHIKYNNGKKAWEYPLKSLITLCLNCHEIIYKINTVGAYKKIEPDSVLYNIVMEHLFDGCNDVRKEALMKYKNKEHDFDMFIQLRIKKGNNNGN